jgi:hypothetical protein
MLFIWRGFGWSIPIILFGAFIISQLLLNNLYGEGYYENNEWPKFAAIIASTILIGGLGYFLNYKKRVVVVNEQTGKKEKSKSHSLFFIPIEYWAIIIPVLFFWFENMAAEKDATEIVLIEMPAINDIYHVDFSKIYEETDQTYKYGIIKVVLVLPEGVEAVISEIAYDKKSGVRKDIQDGKVNSEGYFSKESVTFSNGELEKLKSSDAIYSITRN